MKTYRNLPFSQKIRWRIRGLWALLLLMLAYMVFIGEMGLGDSRIMTPLAQNFSKIYFLCMGYVIVRIVRSYSLLRDRLKMKRQLLEEKDERRRYLHEKSGGAVWDGLCICILFAAFTTSLVNMPAFYTALSLLIAALLFKAAAWCFFRFRRESI